MFRTQNCGMISSVNNTMISASIREDLRTARLAVLAALKQRVQDCCNGMDTLFAYTLLSTRSG